MARYRVPASKVRQHKAKRFGSLKIFPDGRMRLHEKQVKPFLEYTPNRYKCVSHPGQEEYGVYDSTNFRIAVWKDGDFFFIFRVRRNRVVGGWFTVVPSTRALAKSVALIREAGFGKWVKSALESTLISYGSSPYATPERLRAVRQMIESCE